LNVAACCRLGISLLLALSCSTTARESGAGNQLFEGSRAYSAIKTQVEFGPRVPGTPAHLACAEYLAERLGSLADSTWHDSWNHLNAAGDTLKLFNICVSFQPDALRRVLLCAHWDTRPVAEHDPDPSRRDLPIPGANDGGSGVAVLLELARVFSVDQPQVGVDIVLFDCEDYGDFYADKDVLVGSRRFAEKNRRYRPEMGILLDMVGDRQASLPYEGNSWASLPQHCRLVWETAETLGYGQIFVKQVGPAVIDDHIPLLRSGIRCIDIIQMGLPYWHTHQDTPDKCSPSTLEAVGRTLAEVVKGL
jgi:Zn-dependent M28 family amino/carboxypeptidase